MDAATRHVVPLTRAQRTQVVDVREHRHRAGAATQPPRPGRAATVPGDPVQPPLDEALLLTLISTRVAEVAVLVQALAAAGADAHLPPTPRRPATPSAHGGVPQVPGGTGPASQAGPSGRALPGPLDRLSERELDVLRLMARGLSNSAVAAHLHVSERTVEATTAHVFRKLELDASPQVNRRVLAVLLLLGAG